MGSADLRITSKFLTTALAVFIGDENALFYG
jgi:hypothetical protein